MSPQVIRGIGAGDGIAIGPVFRYQSQHFSPTRYQVDDIDAERIRLDNALAATKAELGATVAQTEIGDQEAGIFEAQLMFLEDPALLEQAYMILETQQINAAYAWYESQAHYAAMIRELNDAYLAARADDLADVSQRLFRILSGRQAEMVGPSTPAIIVAEELLPSDTLLFEKDQALAFCTAKGGTTSHVVLLAKSMGIPVVVGLADSLDQLTNAKTVVVDGAAGEVFINPNTATLAAYKQQATILASQQHVALQSAFQPAVTHNGVAIPVLANVGAVEETQIALDFGAEGIGLLRTEFLFLDRQQAPDEDEQVEIYKQLFDQMGSRPVVVRVLDIGGDKTADYLDLPAEPNPFLGVRGIRLLLAEPSIFETQLRALLRAGKNANLKIMFPMISTLDELHQAKAYLVQVQAALEAQQVGYTKSLEVGIMIEVPAAALMAEQFAKEVDFFSIGTNDLTQYTLAADRTNAGVATLTDSLHPPVLRLIHTVTKAAHAHHCWVGLCGDLASNPLVAPLLLGLGIDEFSVSPRAVPQVKQAIRQVDMQKAQVIAQKALGLYSASAVHHYLEEVPK